jgi:hypothetical protein
LTNPYEIVTQCSIAQNKGWYWFWVFSPARFFKKKGLKRAKLGIFVYFDVDHCLFFCSISLANDNVLSVLRFATSSMKV